MPHELLEREDIVKKTNYNPRDLITTVFSAFEKLVEFSDITGTSYTQLQAVNISPVIIHRTGKFGLAIHERNLMPEIQKMWVQFKQFFRASHRDLREISELAVEDAGMYHANMVCNVVTGIQEALQQEQAQTDTPEIVPDLVDFAASAVKKDPGTVGHTASENASTDAGNEDAVCCSSPRCTSRLWRPSRL